MSTTRFLPRWAAILACLLAFSSTAAAQTKTVTFSLDDVWLLPDISDPLDPPLQMTGTFKWTYPVGQFENGSGEFLDLFIPWYGTDIQELAINIDMSSIEFVKRPPITTTDLDITLAFLSDLDANAPSFFDPVTSLFEIQQFGVTHQGHVIQGAVMPDPPLTMTLSGSCPNFTVQVDNATRLDKVALLRADNLGNFTIPNGKPCAGTRLGLSGNVAIASVLNTNAFGQASMSATVPPQVCGVVFLQVLDLATCRVSQTLRLL